MNSSGPPKKGKKPAYQNSFAFRHNPSSKKTRVILSLPNQGLCQRCHDKIEWRKKYRKYKPLKAPEQKSNACSERKVKRAYHTICDDCARDKGICGKCNEKRDIINAVLTKEDMVSKEIEEKDFLEGMKERERRTFLRKRAKVEGEEGEGEEGEEGEGRKRGSDDDEDDDFDDDEDFDEDEEDEYIEKPPKGGKSINFDTGAIEDEGEQKKDSGKIIDISKNKSKAKVEDDEDEEEEEDEEDDDAEEDDNEDNE